MAQDTFTRLVEYNQHLLADVADLLLALPGPVYTEPIPSYSQATVGKHIRHILEFYECLLGSTGAPCVNYDARKRNPDYETQPHAAREACLRIATELPVALSEGPLTQRLNFHPGDESQGMDVPTSVVRELGYVYEHTVHHLALVRLALALLAPDFVVPETLGVAPATLRAQA